MGDLGKAMTKTEANSGAQQNGGKHRVHNYPANPNDRGHRAHQEVNNAYHGIAMQPQINQESQYAPVNQTAMMKPQQQLQQAQLQMQMHGNSTQNEVVNSNGSSIHFQHQHQHQHPIQAQVPQNIQINAMPNGTIMPQHTGKQVQVAQRGRFSIIKDVKQKPGDASNTNGIATTMEDGSINSQVPQQQQQQQLQHVGPSQGSIASSVPQQHSMQQQPQAPATSRGGNSVPSGMIMANPVSVSSGETEVKGRFLVSKSKDALGENNHVRSQSLGATPMAGILNQTNMQQHPTAMPPHQHALQPNQIPVQIQIGHQMNHTPGVTVDSRGQQIPILVQPAVGLHTALPNTVPHTAPGSTKPPKVPKSTKGVERINNTSGGASKGGLSCAVPGGVGKMFHFLDQFKLEVVEADKLVKSLQSDVKFLVSGGTCDMKPIHPRVV